MAGVIPILPKFTFVDATGTPLVGGKVYTYAAGTSTNAATYQDSGLVTPNTNPVVLDVNGQATMWGPATQAYKFIVKTSSDVLVDTLNDIPVSLSSAALAASSGASLVGFLQAGTGAVARITQDKLRDRFSPEDFGCVGDGSADDTANFNKALSAAKTVILTPGKTYLVTALTSAIDGQAIIAYGSKVKLKAGQASSHMLTLSGNFQKVLGGEWDGNRASQTPSAFNYSCIRFTGAHCEVTGTYVHDSAGIGIMGSGTDYCNVHHNQVADCYGYGIYADKTTADGYGNRITDNFVSNTSDTASCGIYFTGQNSPFTYKQHNWRVCGNVVTSEAASPTGVAITVRGVDGIASDNSTQGFNIGLSCDITSDSSIIGNRCFNPAGSAAYCMEVNGAGNTISGNKTVGGAASLSMSVANSSIAMDDNVITGNSFEGASGNMLQIQAVVAGASAQRTVITGNGFTRSAASAGSCINLKGVCQYALISGNRFQGAGSSVSGTRGVYLDTVNSNVTVVGNIFIGFERAVTCYSAAAVAYTDLAFHDNDCRQDVAGTPTYFSPEGAATLGARVSMLWNKQNTTSANQTHYFDYLNKRTLDFNDSFATPEANVARGVGALFVNTNGGAGTTLFVKETGTGNTGWGGK